MTDWKALCAELLQALETEGYAHWTVTPDKDELCLRTRAALAQPEPEGPTNREIEQWADATPDVPREALDPDSACWHRSFSSEKFCNTIRSALEYWCVTPQAQCPAIKPVPVAERPWEREGWCDAEGRCWWFNHAGIPEWQLASDGPYGDFSLPHYALSLPTSQS